MQWNGNIFAGFSIAEPWIKINPGYRQVNVQDLSNQENSMLGIYKKLIALRNKEKVLQYGKYDRLEYKDNQILFTRSFAGNTITVIINFGLEKKVILPAGAKILMGNTELKPNSFIIYKKQGYVN